MRILKLKIIYFLFFAGNIFGLRAQQLPMYTQFMVNNLGMNPAYGGTHLGYEFWAGRRNQWIGFPYAPVQTFVSGTYTFRKNFNYKAVHSVGGYVEKDDAGMFTNKSAYAFYAVHLKINRSYKMSFGIFAGWRSIGINTSAANPNDPAFVVNYAKPVINLYPDFVPGWRIYSKTMYFDLSVRNLYKNKVKQGDQQLGTNSILYPQPIIIYGYRFHSPTNEFIFTPSVRVQGSVVQPPLVDLNFTTYYKKRIGLGVGYRVNNSLAVMVQIRIKNNIMLAFAYEYQVNRLRYYQPNTTEVLFGFSPLMETDSERPANNRIAHCPDFDF